MNAWLAGLVVEIGAQTEARTSKHQGTSLARFSILLGWKSIQATWGAADSGKLWICKRDIVVCLQTAGEGQRVEEEEMLSMVWPQ